MSFGKSVEFGGNSVVKVKFGVTLGSSVLVLTFGPSVLDTLLVTDERIVVELMVRLPKNRKNMNQPFSI